MNIMIIPEDFPKDRYVLEPIIRAMFKYLKKPMAKVEVCGSPRLRGIHQALKTERIKEIIDQYKYYVDVFLLIVDRDGVKDRRKNLDKLEEFAKRHVSNHHHFLAENAWQEVEVWALVGHELPKGWDWKEIRRKSNPKEAYFEPFVKTRNLLDEPGGGRKTLAEESARKYQSVKKRCPEDIGALEEKIRAILRG